MREYLFFILVGILALSIFVVVFLLTKEILKKRSRKQIKNYFLITEEFNSEKIRIIFNFVKQTLMSSQNSNAQQELMHIERLEEQLYNLEMRIKNIYESVEEEVAKKNSWTKIFNYFLSAKKLYTEFLETKKSFEEASDKIISFFKICELQNTKLNNTYERLVAERVLETFQIQGFLYHEKLNFLVDEWTKVKGDFDKFYLKKNETQLIENLKKQKLVLAQLLLVLNYGQKLATLKETTFVEEMEFLKNRLKKINNEILSRRIESLEESIRLFNKEFFMQDVLLTYTRAKSIISEINFIDQELSKQIELTEFVRANFGVLMEFYENQLHAFNLFLKGRKGSYKHIEEEVFDLENQFKTYRSGKNINLEEFELVGWGFEQYQKIKKVAQEIEKIKNHLISLGNKTIAFEEKLKSAVNVFFLCEERISQKSLSFTSEIEALRTKIKQSISFANNLRVMASTTEDFERIDSVIDQIMSLLPKLLVEICLADLVEFLTLSLNPLRHKNAPLHQELNAALSCAQEGEYGKAVEILGAQLKTLALDKK